MLKLKKKFRGNLVKDEESTTRTKKEVQTKTLNKEEPKETQRKKESNMETKEEPNTRTKYKKEKPMKAKELIFMIIKQLWTLFKRIIDIALFAMSFSVASDSCLNGNLSVLYSIYVYLFSLVFMLSSLCKYIVHMQNKLKRRRYCFKNIFKKLTCQENNQ